MIEAIVSEQILAFIITVIAGIMMFAICYIAATSNERKRKRLVKEIPEDIRDRSIIVGDVSEESEHAPDNQYTGCFVELANLRFDVLNRCSFFLTQIAELEARIQKKIDKDIIIKGLDKADIKKP